MPMRPGSLWRWAQRAQPAPGSLYGAPHRTKSPDPFSCGREPENWASSASTVLLHSAPLAFSEHENPRRTATLYRFACCHEPESRYIAGARPRRSGNRNRPTRELGVPIQRSLEPLDSNEPMEADGFVHERTPPTSRPVASGQGSGHTGGALAGLAGSYAEIERARKRKRRGAIAADSRRPH